MYRTEQSRKLSYTGAESLSRIDIIGVAQGNSVSLLTILETFCIEQDRSNSHSERKVVTLILRGFRRVSDP